jgi:hypothetical protein
LKKETFIVHSEIVTLEYKLCEKIENLKKQFIKDLNLLKEEFVTSKLDGKAKFSEITTDIKLLKKREIDTKEKIFSLQNGLDNCEMELGIKIYNN